jgi:glycosyltransferase involved in cell wall biosynthesis
VGTEAIFSKTSSIPSIDVIIPFHLIHQYLREAIASALDSYGVQAKVILVDDSNEKYPSWLQEISNNENVQIIRNLEKGYLGALETGVLHSKSEYVGFLDSDDLTDRFRFYNQICYMRKFNIQICSSKISRIDKSGRILRNQGLLGSQFYSLPPRIRLLFGAYGSDSTLVLSGKLVRESWHTHREFPPQFADYGFLLNAIMKHSFGNCPEGIYYYRTHNFQMSRGETFLDDWEMVFPFWAKLITNLGQLLPRTSRLTINSNVAVALAFPSLFPKLTLLEIKVLKETVKSLVDDLEAVSTLSVQDYYAIQLRLLIASRGRIPSMWRWLPLLLWRVLQQKTSGINPRRN